jgi:hypothetical protein
MPLRPRFVIIHFFQMQVDLFFHRMYVHMYVCMYVCMYVQQVYICTCYPDMKFHAQLINANKAASCPGIKFNNTHL